MPYSFTRTLPEVRMLVLRKLRYIDNGETPSGDDSAVVDEAVDMRLKELHSLGVLWFNVAGSTSDLTLVAGTATASLSALTDFLYPVSARLRIGTEDREINIISHRQYQAIENKAESGEPSEMMVSGGVAYFWPTPADDYTVKLTYHAIALDTDGTSAPDLPVSMLRAFVTLVAADCADDFGVPEQRYQRLQAEAEIAEKRLRMLNTERVDTTPVCVEAF